MKKRVDTNQKELVEYIRSKGATVQHIHTVGKGCPDILVGYNGTNYLFEIKTITGRLTEHEEEFLLNWKGLVHVIRTKADVDRILR